MRLRQFEAELYRQRGGGTQPRESRMLISSRKSAWTAIAVTDETSSEGGHPAVNCAENEMLPVAEWQRGTAALPPANELHKRVVESSAARM